MTQTLFIVGAGASTDFGLPLGARLADLIRIELDQDFGAENHQNGPVAGALRRSRSGLLPEDIQAAHDLRGALLASPSIDHALYTRRGRDPVIRVGKLAIAALIMQGERGSGLPAGWTDNIHDIHGSLANCRQSWIAYLFAALADTRSPDEYEDIFDEVAFITFNYDRCIEQYLFYALRGISGQSADKAASILKEMPIVHVYGSLGIPSFLGGTGHLDFGAGDEKVALTENALKTYTEGVDEGIGEQVAALVAGAARVIFLGFGFDQQNVRVLFPNGPIEGQVLWGTSVGIDERLREFSANMGFPGAPPGFADQDCSSFMKGRARHLNLRK